MNNYSYRQAEIRNTSVVGDDSSDPWSLGKKYGRSIILLITDPRSRWESGCCRSSAYFPAICIGKCSPYRIRTRDLSVHCIRTHRVDKVTCGDRPYRIEKESVKPGDIVVFYFADTLRRSSRIKCSMLYCCTCYHGRHSWAVYPYQSSSPAASVTKASGVCSSVPSVGR